MTQARISTLIPTYRRPHLLPRAIHSALAQTYPEIEVHVFDNASLDKTEEVVRRIAERNPRVKYHCQPSNLGAMGNFQSAISQVRTPFFSILSDDDFLFPRFYEHALAAADRFPEAMFVGGQTVCVEGEKAPTLHPPRWQPGLHRPPEGFEQILRSHIVWTAILFRSDVFQHHQVLHPESGLWSEPAAELQIACREPFVFLSEPFAVWFYRPNAEHFSSFRTNWIDLINMGARQLVTPNLSPRMRGQFWLWFLTQLRGQTNQIFFGGGSDFALRRAELIRDGLEQIQRHPLRPSDRRALILSLRVFVRLAPAMPLLRSLKRRVQHRPGVGPQTKLSTTVVDEVQRLSDEYTSMFR